MNNNKMNNLTTKDGNIYEGKYAQRQLQESPEQLSIVKCVDATLCEDIYSTSGFSHIDFYAKFEELYPSDKSKIQVVDVKNKGKSESIFHSSLHDYNSNKVSSNVKRWFGLYILDLDFEKPYKNNPQYYPSIQRDLTKISDFLSNKGFSYKYSSSGKGIHIFLKYDVPTNQTDDETLISRKVVYDFTNTVLDNHFKTLNLEHYDLWDIDQGFLINPTLGLSLAPTNNYCNNLLGTIDSDEMDVILSKHQLPIKTKAIDDNIDISDIKSSDKNELKDLVMALPRFNPVWKMEERFRIVDALHHIGMSFEECWNFLNGKVSNASKTEIENLYKRSEKVKGDKQYLTNWKFLIYQVNQYSGTKIKINITQETNFVVADDSTILIDKHCGEKSEELTKMFDDNDRILFQSPTGSGKSTLIIEYLKSRIVNNPNEVIALACDTVVLAEQTSTKYDLPVLCGNIHNPRRVSNVGNVGGIYITTYDSLKNFSHIDYLAIDESHLLVNGVSYRGSALSIMTDLMSSVKKCICITATPEYLFPLLKDYKRIVVEAKTVIENNHYYIDDENKTDDIIIQHLIENPLKGKCVIYINSKERLSLLSKRIEAEVDSKLVSRVFFANNPNGNIGLEEIQNNDMIANDTDIILTTSILQNGVNIWNTDIDRCYTDELEKTDLKQFESRFREGGVDIFLLGDGLSNKEVNLSSYMEWSVYCNIATNKCGNFNDIGILYQQKREIYKPSTKDLTYFKNEFSGEYKVNEFGCAYDCYRFNKRFYSLNPEELGYDLKIINLVGLCDTNSIVVETRKLEIKEIRAMIDKLFYTSDNSTLFIENILYNPLINVKGKRRFAMEYSQAYNFYNNNKQLFEKGEKKIKKMSINVMKYSKYFRLSYSESTELYKEEKDVMRFVRGFYYNHFKTATKQRASWFVESINKPEFIIYNLLDCVKNMFSIGEYDFEDVKFKIQTLRNTKKFETYTDFSFNKDKDIMDLVNMCFDVSNRRFRDDDKNFKTVKVFKKYKMNSKIKKYVKQMDIEMNNDDIYDLLTN